MVYNKAEIDHEIHNYTAKTAEDSAVMYEKLPNILMIEFSDIMR